MVEVRPPPTHSLSNEEQEGGSKQDQDRGGNNTGPTSELIG